MIEPWERAKVERVHLVTGENGKLVRYGSGEWDSLFGKVYQGRLKLEGEKGKRVAVKVFKDQDWIREKANEYSQVMRDLREAGLPLPKMFIHRLSEEDAKGFHGKAEAGNLVKIMELYGSHAGSKLSDLEYSPEVNRRIVEYSTKLANAGYPPESYDLYKMLRGRVKPIDLDMFVCWERRSELKDQAQSVLDQIKSLVRTGHSTHGELLKEALKHAKPELKEKIEGLVENPKWAEEKY